MILNSSGGFGVGTSIFEPSPEQLDQASGQDVGVVGHLVQLHGSASSATPPHNTIEVYYLQMTGLGLKDLKYLK